MNDLVIQGGWVVDGTGLPGRRADIGIKDGVIVECDSVGVQGVTVIDAKDLIVAPGFVDVHTHYDAQVDWDPWLTPSPQHGVTTIVGGNCGFSLAPMRGSDASYISNMLSRVEGIPLTALEMGLEWEGGQFGTWLDHFQGKLGVNAAFLVGHSALRRYVLGGEANTREATESEIESMQELLRASLGEGAIGFSTSLSHTHNEADGRPVPSRLASVSELVGLSACVGEFDGTVAIEAIVPGCVNGFSDEELQLLRSMSAAANRPLNWNVLTVPRGAVPARGQAAPRHERESPGESPPRAHHAESPAVAVVIRLGLPRGFGSGVVRSARPTTRATIDCPC